MLAGASWGLGSFWPRGLRWQSPWSPWLPPKGVSVMGCMFYLCAASLFHLLGATGRLPEPGNVLGAPQGRRSSVKGPQWYPELSAAHPMEHVSPTRCRTCPSKVGCSVYCPMVQSWAPSRAGQKNPMVCQPGGTWRPPCGDAEVGGCVSLQPRGSRMDRVTGGVSPTAVGWGGSTLACLEDAAFSFSRMQTWLESISPRTAQSFPKPQPPGVQGEVDFAP